MDPTDVAWMMDYIRAMEQPLDLEAEFRDSVAGHYGPRHITHRDGRLYYSRDTVEVSAQRPLRAVSRDTFVIDGVTYFRLKVAFDEAGNPLALIGTYQGGRTDESPRDP